MLSARGMSCCVVLGTMLACGVGKEKVLISSRAPDGAHSLVITERMHGPDGSIRLTLFSGKLAKTIYADHADRVPGVIEVYWSQNSTLVGALVCDPATVEGRVVIGYDLAKGGAVPAAVVREPLRKLLLARYGPSRRLLSDFEAIRSPGHVASLQMRGGGISNT